MSRNCLSISLGLLLFSLSGLALADSGCNQDEECIPVGQWELGLALGWGKKTNPLADYEDIPLYLLPSVAYYGDNWFFDNGNLGYTLAEDEHFSVNLTTSYSLDRAYFYRWDPSNIFIANGNNQTAAIATQESLRDQGPQPAIGPLEARHFTLLGGAEAFFYTPMGTFRLALGHDLFDVHRGTEAQIKWAYKLALQRWRFDLALLLEWKSREVVDYYYGIRPGESRYWNQEYRAEAAWNRGAEFSGRYVLNEHWELLLATRYTKIAAEIVASPLLNKDYSSSYFIGAAYRF
ncbi:MipA/OmpV family protein [Shewanella sp. AS16]|uniref:MipA/OmpV family protein n=1 Tax=Shewanella sp. AS16 TaxID=2907625 RepID=UPI001F2D9EF6|nr:MipA/OmpV family protein [Shewanella sp. AS16]MCE9685399.1 MipA/OmpV family protein [Shewanella sp. AS16]